MGAEIPAPLSELVAQLAKLPGMGPKSAMRTAMVLLRWPVERTKSLGESISSLRDRLHLCKRCGGLSSEPVCRICQDPARSRDMLCLVADWDSMLTMDAGGFYRGQYLILGGLINPLEHQPAERLDIDRLTQRLAEGEVRELVLALGATIEADNTAAYIHDLVRKDFPAVSVTRLAQGIPLGGEVRHMDSETLRQSLRYRQSLTPDAER